MERVVISPAPLRVPWAAVATVASLTRRQREGFDPRRGTEVAWIPASRCCVQFAPEPKGAQR